MRQQQVSSISDVLWSKSIVPDSFYRLNNTWPSHEKRAQDLLVPSMKVKLLLLISGTEQRREVKSIEAYPIIED